jgi:SAM-dependent methyltransferase
VSVFYLIAGLVRRQMPAPFLFAVMKLRGTSNSAEESPDDYFRQWLAQVERNSLTLEDRHVVEIGSGRYARMALRMLKHGARRVTLIDYYALPLDHPDQSELLQGDCRALGLDWDDVLTRVRTISTDIMALEPGDLGEPADLVVSSAVLEHVRDPKGILARCHSWLRPGGATLHMVDLRDHNFHFRYPFEMLTFSDQTWRQWLDLDGGFHVNRWRAHEHLQALAEAGFEQIMYLPIMSDRLALQAVRHRLDRRFRALPEKLLALQMIYLYGRKPECAGR